MGGRRQDDAEDQESWSAGVKEWVIVCGWVGVCLLSYGLARIRIYSIFVLIKRGLLVYWVNNINQRQRVSSHPMTPCRMNRIESVVFTSGIRRIYIQSVCV